jgi:hypothetical protein
VRTRGDLWRSQFVIMAVVSFVLPVVIATDIADLSPELRARMRDTERRVVDTAARPLRGQLRVSTARAPAIMTAFSAIDLVVMIAVGRPIEYLHSLYRGDRYRIVSRLALGPTATTSGATDAHHPGIPPGDLTARGPVRSATVGDIQ